MLFFLRNAFESRNYKYVEVTENPDFIATIDAHIPDRKYAAHPVSLTAPVWFPKDTVFASEGTSGSGNLNSIKRSKYSDKEISGGNPASKSDVPGYMPTQTYTDPNYTTGIFYPVIRVDVLDPHTFKPVWTGFGKATASNSDLRLSGQTIIIFILGEFPEGPLSYEPVIGPFGFAFKMSTNNGNDYYPTVYKVIDKSPAQKAGIKESDMISFIDGISVKNKPLSEIMNLLQIERGGKMSIIVLRPDKQVDLEIFPKPRWWSTN